jgi:hypothetical protein
MGGLQLLAGRGSTLPPLAFELSAYVADDPITIVREPIDEAPHSISGFVCVIDYADELRLITARRYDRIGEFTYVGGICQTAGGYRQFRCDRIGAVSDAYTGEVRGDGSYFARFSLDRQRDKAPTWGLTQGRKHLLVCGLNIMAFMARCDGRWHPLESGAIERFICSMWLRKEWDGEPPIEEIVAHAQRLAPDSEVFFRSLGRYAPSQSSCNIVRRAVVDLIEADGLVCCDEVNWETELRTALAETAAASDEKFFELLREQGVLD